MSVKLIDGYHQKKVPYFPTVDVTGGDVILIGTTLTIASVDLAANDPNGIGVNWPNGGGRYSGLNTDGLVFAAGADVFYDIANKKVLTAGGDGKIGVCTTDAAATDERVEFIHER